MADTSKKTFIVFSGEMDKALAAFVMANGAAAMGDDVTMFFTFWGLSIVRKPQRVATSGKSGLQRIFDALTPRGADHLKLSKLNFGGVGRHMMNRVMTEQHIMSLDELMATAREQGVKMQACTMSMDMMGFKPEEMLDGLEFVGVASYLAEAEESSLNLFI